MKHHSKTIILSAILSAAAFSSGIATAGVSASQQRFSPDVRGYMERARVMNDAGNFAGVIDQLRHIDTQQISLSAEQAEEYTFLLANAYYQRGDKDCLRLLSEFISEYPGSYLSPVASMAIGDYYFFNHDWPDALEAYRQVDSDRLNRDLKLDYVCRTAICMIKTGYFREAAALVDELRGHARYEDAYYFYDAYLDYINGDFKKAYEGFSKVRPGAEGLQPGYYMAQIEYTWGRYDDVIRHGNALLRTDRNSELSPEIYRIVGLSYFKTGDPLSGQGDLEQYLAKCTVTPAPDALYAMGVINYDNKNYLTAEDYFSQVTDNHDKIGQSAWLYLGQCYLQRGNTSQAALAFEKAADMEYDSKVSEAALYNYVTAVTQGGKVPFSSSSKMLERFVSRYPDSEFVPEVEKYLATAYYNDRNYKKAIECIDAVRNPGHEMLAMRQKVLYQLGVEAITNGRDKDAVGYLRQAASMTGYDPALAAQASLWLGDALFKLDRFDEARKAYEKFTSSGLDGENRALGFYNLAYTLYKQKDYAAASTNFAKAINCRPALNDDMANDARIRRADCLYYEKKYPEAKALYSEAVEKGAVDSDYALYRRAILYGLDNQYTAKINDLSRIEREYPDSPLMSKIMLELAHTYEDTGNNDMAARAYKKRLDSTAEVGTDELLRMAEAMHQSGRSSDLLQVIDRIYHAGGLEADELALVRLYQAEALADLGRMAEADAILSELALNPTSLPGSEAAVTLAENALAKKDFRTARDLMEDFTENGTPHEYWLARGFIALADAYYGLGETALAREYIISLSENYPGDEQDISQMISSRLKKWKKS